ncbi:4-hydroxyphenylacetate 3-hydroxylase N-terminal domain-containing protein [Microbacterium alcoholitolerans]|uniref:4-hydroxyphenylacetate 3-hydroxylase N-terminal domain-containing protein n=1 Tax=unclassified Microbacterium TaxID=2609290 RepID=UPI003D17C53B
MSADRAKAVAAASTEVTTTTSPHLLTGAQYKDSLRDGRRIVYQGEEITDVPNHPLFKNSVDLWAELYDAQHRPETADVTTYFDAELGERVSTAWLVPRDRDDLDTRRRLLEFSTDRTLGVFGRPPDYGPTLAMGFLSASHLIEQTEPDAPGKILDFVNFARERNLLSTDVIADAQADRTLATAEMPGRLRCVEERPDGIVVYGVKPAASGATIGHWGGIATLLSPGTDPEATIWAYVPVNSPGLSFVPREGTLTGMENREDHPLDAQGEEVDAFMFFDHVFIPRERLFSFRNPRTLPLYLDVAVFPQWAILARMARRAKIFAATAQLIVDILGTASIPAVRAVVAEVFAYAAALESFVLAAEDKGSLTPHGIYVPDRTMVTAGRLHATANLPNIMQILRELCGQGLVSRVTAKDLEHEQIGAWVDEFLPGHNISARGKNKFMNFVWDLTSSAHASRVNLFENVNSTPPPAIRQQLYQAYDPSQQVKNLTSFIGLEFTNES